MKERKEKESDAAYCFRLLEFKPGTPEHEEMKRILDSGVETEEETIRFPDGSILMADKQELQVWEEEEEEDGTEE